MVLRGSHDTVTAVIPIGAGQTLMAGANDAIVTAITNGSVLELAARKAARHDQVLQAEVAVRAEREGVSRVVTMFVSQQAAKAQVIVLTVIAADQVAIIGFCITALAKSESA